MSADLSNLISQAVTAKLTPEFIEAEVDSRVGKLIVESIDRALRRYSDTGKLIEKAIEEALRVDRLDLPSYGSIVAGMLKTQIEAHVAPLVAGQLAKDMDELLGLAPKEVKLSEIATFMRERHEGEAYGPVITVELSESKYGSRWLYLDDEEHHERRAKYDAKFGILLSKDGTISSARMSGKPINAGQWIGRSYGIEQRIRAYVACGTKIILDEDAVCVSVGDY